MVKYYVWFSLHDRGRKQEQHGWIGQPLPAQTSRKFITCNQKNPVALQTVEPLGSLTPVNICVRETTPLITTRMWFLCEILQHVQIKQKAEDFFRETSPTSFHAGTVWNYCQHWALEWEEKIFGSAFHFRSHDCLTTFQANGHCNPNKCLFQRRVL